MQSVPPGEFASFPLLQPRHRALLVEDDPLVRETLGTVLNIAGFTVVEAEDTDAGRRQITTGDFHVVVIDANLPGSLDGASLAEEAAGRGLALVLMSGHPDSMKRLSEAGTRFLQKPFAPERLVGLIRLEMEMMSAEQDGKRGPARDAADGGSVSPVSLKADRDLPGT